MPTSSFWKEPRKFIGGSLLHEYGGEDAANHAQGAVVVYRSELHSVLYSAVAKLLPAEKSRPNERALADFLAGAPQQERVQFIVVAAHVHNYERFLRDGITYVVSGGGGAKPDMVNRGPGDLYHEDRPGPTYRYLKWTLREDRIDAEMVRLSDPNANAASWEVRDRFQIRVK